MKALEQKWTDIQEAEQALQTFEQAAVAPYFFKALLDRGDTRTKLEEVVEDEKARILEKMRGSFKQTLKQAKIDFNKRLEMLRYDLPNPRSDKEAS